MILGKYSIDVKKLDDQVLRALIRLRLKNLGSQWIYENSMTDIEKEKYPTYKTTGGYLKTKTMYEAWADVWNNLDDTEKQVFLDLPNFDADKFKIITGIEVKK